jgi:hypothetical protein
MILRVLLVGASLVSATTAQACQLQIDPPFPQGRVAEIRLSMRHGMVTAVSPVPIGWRMTEDNDPNWITSTVGIGIVGAAWIEVPEVSGMFTITPEPGHDCAELMRGHLVHLTLKLAHPNADSFTSFRFKPEALRLTD